MTSIPSISQTKSDKDALQPPLHSAIISGKQAKITRLLEGSTHIDAQDRNGQTALHLAVRMGKVASVGLLLEYGASAAIQNSNKLTAYDLAKKKTPPKDCPSHARSTKPTLFGNNRL